MASATLHKTHAVKALRRLSTLATASGTVLELALCHGAIVVAAFRAVEGRRGEVRPNDIVTRLADIVSDEMRLRKDWLESDIAAFMTEASADHTLRPEEFAPGVVISINGGARMLAQKLNLLREDSPPDATDERDAEFLLRKISVSAPGQIRYIYERAFPDAPMSDRAQELIQRAFRARPLVKA